MPITLKRLKIAENRLLSYEQSKRFSHLVKDLKNKERLTSKHCNWPVKNLDPFLQEGTLRVGGRLGNASVKYEARHPAILPSKSHFSHLIIRDYHEAVGHAGLGHTFNALRKRFCVLNGSSTIRRVIADCFVCRRANAVPAAQKMADLPKSRLQTQQPVFFHTGVDCFGPFLVKQGRSAVK